MWTDKQCVDNKCSSKNFVVSAPKMDHFTVKLLAYSSDAISQGNLSKVQELFPENLVSRKGLQKTAVRPVLPALLYFCSFSPAESELPTANCTGGLFWAPLVLGDGPMERHLARSFFNLWGWVFFETAGGSDSEVHRIVQKLVRYKTNNAC